MKLLFLYDNIFDFSPIFSQLHHLKDLLYHINLEKILSNDYFGHEFQEEQNIHETQYMLNFIELFPKDMKYFLGQDFSFDKNVTKLLKTYEEFLIINKSFTKTEYNTDVILPKNVKPYKDEFKKEIDNAISEGNLNKLADFISNVI